MESCSDCKHWKIIETHGSTRGDEGMKSNGFKNCLLSLKVNDQFAKFKFTHATYTCKDWEKKCC